MFLLQIVTPQGEVIRFPGGGPLEKEFVESVVKAIVAKGVGLFKTEATVEAAVREGLTETIYALKHDTKYVHK